MTHFIEDLQECLTKIDTSQNVIFAGDFNIDMLNINQCSAISRYLDFFMSNGFLPLITKPTRFSNYNATLINLIFVKSRGKN